eukprot:scaffold431_cov334-Pavlova_lutheri.AAC.69
MVQNGKRTLWTFDTGPRLYHLSTASGRAFWPPCVGLSLITIAQSASRRDECYLIPTLFFWAFACRAVDRILF